MKKILESVILPIIFLAFCIPAALRGEIQYVYNPDLDEYVMDVEVKVFEDFQYYIDEGQVFISSYLGNETAVTVPATIENLPVVAIHFETDSNRGIVTSITIPEGVREIPDNAFTGCENLREIRVAEGNPNYKSVNGVLFSKDGKTLVRYPCGRTEKEYQVPDGVTAVRYGAFFDCLPLKSVSIPVSVTDMEWSIFAGCRWLREIRVAEGNPNYKSVNGVLFSKDGKSLKVYPAGKGRDYRVPEGTTVIDCGAFEDCDRFVSATIPEGVTEIEAYAFQNGRDLTAVAIPKSVKKIGNHAFHRCIKLTSITIPECVTEIGEYTFSVCKALTMVTIPESVTEIGKGAFIGCRNLTSVTIPESVTKIGWAAFAGCRSLGSVTIPENVTEIETRVFERCTCLTEIRVAEGNPNYKSVDGVLFTKDGKKLLSYPYGRDWVYQVPEGVTTIGESAFSDCRRLLIIVIPENVTEIEEFAFYGCLELTIVGKKGSEAERYAEEKQIKFGQLRNGKSLIRDFRINV
ncbi:MAG: leucine-rich repeat protein [Planctomycetia bacterium]|nr:leucine-rich repeat protein [Planctomycetia bacterium]